MKTAQEPSIIGCLVRECRKMEQSKLFWDKSGKLTREKAHAVVDKTWLIS